MPPHHLARATWRPALIIMRDVFLRGPAAGDRSPHISGTRSLRGSAGRGFGNSPGRRATA
jgi:hypothetical protein